jgi:hypothetical protein
VVLLLLGFLGLALYWKRRREHKGAGSAGK